MFRENRLRDWELHELKITIPITVVGCLYNSLYNRKSRDIRLACQLTKADRMTISTNLLVIAFVLNL